MIYKKRLIDEAKRIPDWRIDREYMNSENGLKKAIRNDDKKAYKSAMKYHQKIEALKLIKDTRYGQ